jgi:hypothetical protein
MHLFEKVYQDNLDQLKNRPPIPNYSLDPNVFEFLRNGEDPVLNDLVRMQIIRDIQTINQQENEYNTTRVFDYFIFGPILKLNSSDKCPLQVLVQLNTNNLSDILKERILQQTKKLNRQTAPGTTHPLQYIPTIRPINLDHYPAVFHPYTNKWLKKPVNTNN